MQLGQPRDHTANALARAVITLKHVELENSLLALSLVEPRTRGLRDLPCDFKYSLRNDQVLLYTRISPFKSIASKDVLKALEVIIGFRFVRERASPVTPSCNKYYNN